MKSPRCSTKSSRSDAAARSSSKNHPAVGVLGALVDVLTAHERKPDGTGIVVARRGDGPSDSAAVAVLVGEAIPIHARWFQASDEGAACPVRFGGDCDGRRCGQAAEPVVFRHFDDQASRRAAIGPRPAGPQNHARRVGVARRYSFRIEIPHLAPRRRRKPGAAAEHRDGAERGGCLQKPAPRKALVLIVVMRAANHGRVSSSGQRHKKVSACQKLPSLSRISLRARAETVNGGMTL
jgi:hypothetical protein